MRNVKIFVIALIVMLGWFALHFGGELGTWKGTSYESYLKRAYAACFWGELPDTAGDFKFYCENYGIFAYSMASFSLNGSEYDDFVASFAEMHMDDELDFVGKNVSETLDYYDSYGHYIGFPKSQFEKVIDDKIEDYTIIYYDSDRSTKIRIYAVVANVETGKIVIYTGGSN